MSCPNIVDLCDDDESHLNLAVQPSLPRTAQPLYFQEWPPIPSPTISARISNFPTQPSSRHMVPAHLISTYNTAAFPGTTSGQTFTAEEDVVFLTERTNRMSFSPSPVPRREITQPIRFKNEGVYIICAHGKTTEFDDKSFMRITQMVLDAQNQIVLIGKRFRRQNVFGAKVPKRPNELIWVVEEGDDQNTGLTQRILIQQEVIRNRELHITNHEYPRDIRDPNHPRNHPSTFDEGKQNAKLGPLFCRLKRSFWIGKTVDREQEEMWEHVSEIEADAGYSVTAHLKRQAWRGPTDLGGSSVECRTTYDIESGRERSQILRKYTFADGFCGAGGASCGARQAGLQISWSFDKDLEAILTYRLNFPQVDARVTSVEQFIDQAFTENLLVDILHLSPPCQYFSGAHTVASEIQDEANQAALLCVRNILERVKPRVVTLEETSGLEQRHPLWFNALLHDIISIGYSLHWKLVNCADYGVSQSRKRLVIIAAGPGENLPPFPEPTHGIGTGLQRLETVGEIIGRIPHNTPNHDTTRLFDTPKPAYTPNIIAKTITTSGGIGNYHPSGLRDFTIREFACLQTLPMNYKFAGRHITRHKRQIGNMVPPRMAAAINKSIIDSLREVDEETERRLREIGGNLNANANPNAAGDDDIEMIL